MNNMQKLKAFIPGIFSYNITSRFKPLLPRKLIVVLTYRCNSRCIMCNIWKMKPHKELSLEQWGKILKDPLFKHIEKINITGGEALLSPMAIPFIQLCMATMPKLWYIDMVSNGFETELIRNKVEEIVKLSNSRGISFNISISLDGVDKKHEEIRRIPHAFKRVAKTILALQLLQKQYPFSLSIGSVVMRQTLSQAQKLKYWSIQHRASQYFQIVGFHDSYVHNAENETDVNFTEKQKHQLLQLLETLGKSKNWKDIEAYYWKDMYFMYKNGTPRSTPCPFLYDEFAIDALGNIYYCLSEKSIGNVKRTRSGTRVSEIYFDPKNIQYRNYVKQYCCPTCNSKCNVRKAIAYDFKKYAWFRLTGIPWYGIPFHSKQLQHYLQNLFS